MCMGEACTESAKGSHWVLSLQTHFEGCFFLCLDQRPGQPLKTTLSHAAPQTAVSCNQIRTGKSLHPNGDAWAFEDAMWEQAFAFGNQSQDEEQGDFYFSKDGNKKRPRRSPDSPPCTVKEGRENVPSDSCSHPRLFGWVDGHQLQHLQLYAPSPSVCLPIAQRNKSWMQISEEYYNNRNHTRAVLPTQMCLGVRVWSLGGLSTCSCNIDPVIFLPLIF